MVYTAVYSSYSYIQLYSSTYTLSTVLSAYSTALYSHYTQLSSARGKLSPPLDVGHSTLQWMSLSV